jgi:hypothetical protein
MSSNSFEQLAVYCSSVLEKGGVLGVLPKLDAPSASVHLSL